MAICRNVSGNWWAVYYYNANPQLPQLPPVRFMLTLKQGWFGRFAGTSVDEPTGVPGIGEIDGRLTGARIRFVRRMPEWFIGNGDQSVSLREYLLSLGGSSDFDLPVPPIYYAGEFADARSANGTWTIHETTVELSDGGSLFFEVTTGTWTMEHG